tara:strand:+ start:139857 stop:140309 length:453 start_codon:yes stop_codon:yes gene_type:complete
LPKVLIEKEMQKRDLFKDEIERLGKALANLLSEIVQLKSGENNIAQINNYNKRLQQQLNISVDELISLTKPELLSYLKNKNFNANHIDSLAKILVEQSHILIHNKELLQAKSRLNKAIELLEITDEISNTLSFERIALKNNIIRKITTLQ